MTYAQDITLFQLRMNMIQFEINQSVLKLRNKNTIKVSKKCHTKSVVFSNGGLPYRN